MSNGVEERKTIIIDLLPIEREGMIKLVEWLSASDFFTAPASTRFHGVGVGGLARHSLNVYKKLYQYNEELKLETPADSMIVACLLHDVCKIGAYKESSTARSGYCWNKAQPKGHAMLSLVRIAEYIKLTELEVKMIQYHMGLYGLNEFDPSKGEYSLRKGGLANAWYHYPIVKVMYFCDELVSLGE